MKKKHITKHCKKHGECRYVYVASGDRYRCCQCRVEAVQKRRTKLKNMAVAYKGGKCTRCGYNRFMGALEFHHIDPSKKEFSISSDGHTMSWEKAKKELDKCILVCSNCHREIHGSFGDHSLVGKTGD